MREIRTHIVEGSAAKELGLMAMDAPGSGGAHHYYWVTGFEPANHPEHPQRSKAQTDGDGTHIFMQCGPIGEGGINGMTNEVLLAIVQDRLECFQAGPFRNDMNQRALNHVNEAMFELQQRTRERMARGVEGTHNK